MKRRGCIAFLTASVLLGAARLLDLCLFTDPAAGFVTAGPAWVRYAVLFGFVAVVFLVSALTRPPQLRGGIPVPARPLLLLTALVFAAAGVLGAGDAVAELLTPTTNFGRVEGGSGMMLFAFLLRIALGASFLAFGGWCALQAQKNRPKQARSSARALGYVSLLGFFALPILRYAENPSSPDRILRVLPIFSALAALAFMVKLMGVFCVEGSCPDARGLAVTCIAAFFLCTCVELPQLLWQLFNGGVSALQLALAAALACVGVLGASTALTVSGE